MRRFTAILLSISLASAAWALEVCVPPGASTRQLQELNGVELALEEEGVPFTRSFNCTQVELRYPGGVLKVDSLLPSADEEASQIASLVDGSRVAVVYSDNLEELASKVVSLIGEERVLFEYRYRPGEKNYSDILRPLVELKDVNRQRIDTVVFLGGYQEAILILPFFRIFHPFPKVVASWRIYHPLIFAYRSFMNTVVFYEWCPLWEPLIHIRGFVVRYLQKYRKVPTRFAALGYDAARIVVKALEENLPVEQVRILGVTGLISLGRRVYLLVKVRNLPRIPPPVY